MTKSTDNTSLNNDEPRSWAALFAHPTRAVAVIIAVGIALHSANIYIASAVMPSVADDIGGLSLYAWATTVFVFAAVLGSTATATVLGRSGTRNAYRTAILTVGAGTLVCALAPSMPVLLTGRALQGFGGGLLFALAYSLVRLVLAERLWPYAMGLISAMWGVGTFAGPALGGSFAEFDQWRLAFWIIVPLTAFFAVWGGAHLPREAGRQAERPAVPVMSVGLLGATVLVLSAASISTQVAINVAGLIGAGVLFVGWIAHERRTSHRLLPAATFTADGRLALLYGALALLMVAATPEIFISYFAQHLQGIGPLAAGYLATAIAAGWTSASLLLSGTRRSSLMIQVGPIVSAGGLALLVVVGPLHDGSFLVTGGVALGFGILGWGIGMAWPHLSTAVLSVVPEADQELAGASVTTVQLTAAAAGAAVGGAIANVTGFSDPGGVVGAHQAAQLLYPVMLVAPVAAFVLVRSFVRARTPRSAAPLAAADAAPSRI
jgi:MFS family permease